MVSEGVARTRTTSSEDKTNGASATDEWDFALQVMIECIINELLKTCKWLNLSKIR